MGKDCETGIAMNEKKPVAVDMGFGEYHPTREDWEQEQRRNSGE